MKIDEYTLHARIYPVAICAIPALVLIFAFENDTVSKILNELATIEVAGKVTVGVAVFFLLMQFARFVGKDVFERKLFNDELNFPTTDYLLPADTRLSAEFKEKLADIIGHEFGLALPTAAEVEADEMAARRRVKDIVARIRAAVGRPPLLLQRNWEYGFARNLVGGSTIAVLLSVLGVALHFGTTLGYVFAVCAVVFAVVLLASSALLRRYAGHYAQQLLYAFAGDAR